MSHRNTLLLAIISKVSGDFSVVNITGGQKEKKPRQWAVVPHPNTEKIVQTERKKLAVFTFEATVEKHGHKES